MAQTRLSIARKDIVRHFESLAMRVFKRSQIDAILSENRDFWRLGQLMTVSKFIEFLIDRTQLKAIRFEFPSRTILRYTWGDVPIYELVLSLYPESYFTHYTALYLHNLTDQVPKTIYLNFEQPHKLYRDRTLDQSRIEIAFKSPMRTSKNIAIYKDHKICVLNGMYTGKLGVISLKGPQGENISVTDLERTLIDIVVRPGYAGGVFEVLKAYKLAKDHISVNRLAAMLKKLDYAYPYHQCIGFYLERAKYKKASIELMQKFEIKYNFYLTHYMKDMDYSKKWRLFFPKDF
jgi:predicted transcriptional regulator of viral defense system